MSSIITGYEYDIFISYRQKDNRGYKWVSEFVEELTTELESTFKEEISIYFDFNPYDGLMESHEVEGTLIDKLKCLVFIPIISRTYCDPNSFAWEHEFKAFVNLASQDKFGLKVRLPGGNVASRVLPVRIYDLNKDDVQMCEAVLNGPLRGIEFIYKSAGVNRPLRANEDHSQDNLNKTYYHDQINKLSSSIQDIIYRLKSEQTVVTDDEKVPHFEAREKVIKDNFRVKEKGFMKMSGSKILYGILILLSLTTLVFTYPILFKRDSVKDLRSEEILGKAIRVSDRYGFWKNYTGKIHLTYAEASYMAPEEAWPKAAEAANRALQLDTELAEVHATIATIAILFERDWPKAEKEYEKALQRAYP